MTTINYTGTSHESHEIHDSHPYAILFIFTSCTIGGKVQTIFIHLALPYAFGLWT